MRMGLYVDLHQHVVLQVWLDSEHCILNFLQNSKHFQLHSLRTTLLHFCSYAMHMLTE